MSRKNVEHTPSSLFALAEELQNAATMIEEAGKRLRAAKHVQSVSVSHQSPIDTGLAAVPLFCDQIDFKIKVAAAGFKR